MLDHVSISVYRIKRSQPFYDAVMAALGHEKIGGDDCWLGYGQRRRPDNDVEPYLSVVMEVEGTVNESRRHWAFTAPDRAAVDAFYQAALDNGGRCDGEPGLRPDYHDHYYAAFVFDPDGNRIEAVCHRVE